MDTRKIKWMEIDRSDGLYLQWWHSPWLSKKDRGNPWLYNFALVEGKLCETDNISVLTNHPWIVESKEKPSLRWSRILRRPVVDNIWLDSEFNAEVFKSGVTAEYDVFDSFASAGWFHHVKDSQAFWTSKGTEIK